MKIKQSINHISNEIETELSIIVSQSSDNAVLEGLTNFISKHTFDDTVCGHNYLFT